MGIKKKVKLINIGKSYSYFPVVPFTKTVLRDPPEQFKVYVFETVSATV